MCEKIPLNKLLSSTLTNPIVGNNSHFAITMHMDVNIFIIIEKTYNR
jgi:hypothetical protein